MNNNFKKIFKPINFIPLVLFAPVIFMTMGKFYQMFWMTLFPCVDKYCDGSFAPTMLTIFTAVALVMYLFVKATE